MLLDVESHNDDSKCYLHVISLMINCGQMRVTANYLLYMRLFLTRCYALP